MANVYNGVLKRLVDADIDGNLPSDFRCLLLRSDGGNTPTFDATDVTVADMDATAGNTEVSVGGYARQTMTSEGTIAGPPAAMQAQKCTFTALAAGQDVGAAVVYVHVTNDADSYVVAFFDLTNTPTNGGNIEVRWNNVDGVGTFLSVANL